MVTRCWLEAATSGEGVGRDLKAHLVPSTRAGCSKPGLDHCQGWDISHLSEQAIAVSHRLRREELLL